MWWLFNFIFNDDEQHFNSGGLNFNTLLRQSLSMLEKNNILNDKSQSNTENLLSNIKSMVDNVANLLWKIY